jgi:hypothetical protein
LLVLAAILGAAYFYVDSNGGSVGFPPFTPMFYWKYSGEASYPLAVRGHQRYAKLAISGELKEGQLELYVRRNGQMTTQPKVFSGTFSETTRYPKMEGDYEFIFKMTEAKGFVRHDLVATADIF